MTKTKKPRPYFSLLTRESDGKWYPQFGDYERSVVADELRDSYLGPVGMGYRRADTQIVRTATDLKADLDAVLTRLNGEA